MTFIPYHHVEKLGHEEVSDILYGTCHIYSKLDGTNASVWSECNYIYAGSRKRQLEEGKDNAGFLSWVYHSEGLQDFLATYPQYRLYGEWLVPHTLKTYREEAWRRFWVFDVLDSRCGKLIPVEDLASLLTDHGIDYISALAIINNPTEEQLVGIMNNTNTFLIEDGAGPGEGIVIKRYDNYVNRFDKQVWAKMVRNEFKEANKKTFGIKETDGRKVVESEIAEEFVTEALVKKELSKIVHELADDDVYRDVHDLKAVITLYHEVMMTNRKQIIPRLLETVFYCLIKEEAWAFLKQHKFPAIDFKRLRTYTIQRTKKLVPELF
jgi:hypothetical protein